MSKNSQFEKFANKKRGSAIKEQFKQEKKAAKKERAAAIEKRFEEKRRVKLGDRAVEARGRTGAAPARETKSSDLKQAAGNKDAKTPVTGAKDARTPVTANEEAKMPVNKYIAHGGICSRRDAAVLVKNGEVTVNGEVISDPGTKVSETDIVKVKGKKVIPSRNFVYILLNKPKDYITTTEDPQGRKTVIDLIRQATNERVYPIGRLDRNTSGVLIFTNDGDLAQTLSHPKHEIQKVYEVRLDRELTKNDFDKLLTGITLEDGFIAPDALAYADSQDKSVIGIEIHSGRNRIVRRIFEKLGYDVRGLDRVMYAGLTKKNVQRGKWRLLLEKEVRILKHFNKSAPKK
jgi:23S rRNA pseudouridine2605 synthase